MWLSTGIVNDEEIFASTYSVINVNSYNLNRFRDKIIQIVILKQKWKLQTLMVVFVLEATIVVQIFNINFEDSNKDNTTLRVIASFFIKYIENAFFFINTGNPFLLMQTLCIY